MRSILSISICICAALQSQGPPPAQTPAADDPIKTVVSRLDLDKYKRTIKGLTQFGDRRQGTARNRAAIDWIEAQLKSYGCTNTERIKYTYTPRAGRGGAAAIDPATGEPVAGGQRGQGQPGAAQGGRGRGTNAQGGGRIRGTRARTGVNNDPNAQPDEKLRELDREPTPEGPGPREEVYCTKVGTTHPDEMYIVGAHMDGIGWGEAANDDGSGTDR